MNRLIVLVAIALLTTASCARKSGNVRTVSQPTPMVTRKPVVDAYPVTGDAKEDLRGVFTRFWGAKAFRIAAPTETTVSYVAPDRYSFVNPLIGMIMIGKDSYVRPEYTWKKSEYSFGKQLTDYRERFSQETFAGLKDIKFEGSQTLGDVETYVYSFSGVETLGSGRNYSARLWINKEDGLPSKLTYDFPSTNSVPATYTFSYSGISIERPATGKN